MPRPRDSQAHARILDAARSLLSEVGPTFSIGDVAARAGLSRGTVYRRFGSHAQLLDALVSERGVEPEAIERTSSRDRILDAVGALLRTRDFNGITVDDVAARAGVGVATLYRHFGDRDGMIEAFGRERSPRRFAATLDVGDGSHLADDLRQLAATALRFMRDYPHIARLVFQPQAVRDQLPAPLHDRTASTRRALERYLDRQIRAGRLRGDAATLARLFFGMLIASAMLDESLAASEYSPGPDGDGGGGDGDGDGDGRPSVPAISIEDTAAAIVDTLLHGWLCDPRTDTTGQGRTG